MRWSNVNFYTTFATVWNLHVLKLTSELRLHSAKMLFFFLTLYLYSCLNVNDWIWFSLFLSRKSRFIKYFSFKNSIEPLDMNHKFICSEQLKDQSSMIFSVIFINIKLWQLSLRFLRSEQIEIYLKTKHWCHASWSSYRDVKTFAPTAQFHWNNFVGSFINKLFFTYGHQTFFRLKKVKQMFSLVKTKFASR